MPGYEHLSKAQMPKDIHAFAQKGERPLSLMEGTNKSANIVWQSKQTHREGGLAGMAKENIGTLYKTGF